MELLFRREQTPGKLTRVAFKLWAKIEPDDDERTIVNRYKLDNAILIEAIQEGLLRKTIILSVIVFVVVFSVLNAYVNLRIGFLGALVFAGGFGFWYINENRETIFVKDLLHGRDFKCDSVVELARKEAWLGVVVDFLQQVMESAKHWDGTERHTVEPLPKDEARQVIIKGI